MNSTTPPTDTRRAHRLASMFLGQRLQDANEPPGLRATIVERVALQMGTIKQRGQAQIDYLRSPSSRRLPEAYLVDEEILENELQRGAAGIRAARAREGIFSDPSQFEYELAQRLTPSALWALRSEASRVPRPPTRTAVLDWSAVPIPWLNNNDDEWPPAGAVALAGVTHVDQRDGYMVRVSEAPYSGWIQLGMLEQQETLASSSSKTRGRRLFVGAGLEARDTPAPHDSFPFSDGTPSWWAATREDVASEIDPHTAQAALRSEQVPLCALADYAGQQGAPHRSRGVGLHALSLAPSVEIIAALGLQAEKPSLRHILIDANGPALVGRNWRGFLVHGGDYYPLVPAVHGTDLLIRPDLYDQLESITGADRLSMRVIVDFSEEDDIFELD